VCSVDVLAPLLLRVVDHQQMKVKIGCLEYLLYLMPAANSFLTAPNRMLLLLASSSDASGCG
jgi:hypothetical protein